MSSSVRPLNRFGFDDWTGEASTVALFRSCPFSDIPVRLLLGRFWRRKRTSSVLSSFSVNEYNVLEPRLLVDRLPIEQQPLDGDKARYSD